MDLVLACDRVDVSPLGSPLVNAATSGAPCGSLVYQWILIKAQRLSFTPWDISPEAQLQPRTPSLNGLLLHFRVAETLPWEKEILYLKPAEAQWE